MNQYDQLRSLINQLADRGSRKERNALAIQARDLLHKIENAAPPATSEEALDRAYEQGAFKAMELYKVVRHEKEGPIRKAQVGDAYVVLNGLLNYGQGLLSTAESAVATHLLERRRGQS